MEFEIRIADEMETFGDALISAWVPDPEPDQEPQAGSFRVGRISKPRLKEAGFELQTGWLTVLDEYQRQGVGTRILEAFIEWAGDRMVYVDILTDDGYALLKSYLEKNPNTSPKWLIDSVEIYEENKAYSLSA